MKYKTYHRVLVIAVPLLSLAALCVIAAAVLSNFSLLPCPCYTLFHIYCPGCGSTRAVTALMRGDILLALRQNAAVIVMIILALMFYIELVLKVFGKSFRFPLIHNEKFYFVLLGLWLVYAVLRNFIPAIAPIGTRAGLGLTFN